jgi:hypothetical protein
MMDSLTPNYHLKNLSPFLFLQNTIDYIHNFDGIALAPGLYQEPIKQ